MYKNLIWIVLFLVNCRADLTFARTQTAFHQESQCNSTDLNPSWMSSLPDSRPLSLLSVPGTHDSLALYGGEQWQCQSMSLRAQLESGIRALDVRCRHVSNRFMIYHSFIYQRVDFVDVLKTCQQFLLDNPSEAILMRVKKEWLSEGNTETFEATFVREYLDKFRDLIWIPQSRENVSRLTLGQVRGKVVILQDFDSHHHQHDESKYEAKVYGPQFKEAAIQDDFTLITIWSLYGKWLKVKDQLYGSNSSLSTTHAYQNASSPPFYINFLSGSVGVKPYFVASGHTEWGTNSQRQYFGLINVVTSPYKYEDFPREKCLLGGRYCLVFFEGTNMLTFDRLTGERFHFVGIVYADFPGCGLIRAIIDVNKNL